MIQGVNIEQVRSYNNSLKEYQQKAAQARAAIDYNTNELNRLCSELSNELGIEVTPENVERIRAERIEKIENTLKVGNEILARIKSEEETINSANTIQQAQAQGIPQTPVMIQPQVQAQAVPQAPTMPQVPTMPQAPAVDFNQIGSIPSIFGNN